MKPLLGDLIVIDGVDGLGKTHQTAMLAKRLGTTRELVVSREPTDGPWGKKIRASAISGRMKPDDELHAFEEDRKQHIREVVRPALEAGKTVLLDRYFYSTIAYQSAAKSFNIYSETKRDELWREFLDRQLEYAIVPTATIFLWADLSVSRSRMGLRRSTDRFEGEQLFLVREAYEWLSRHCPEVSLVDASGTKEAVEVAIAARLSERHKIYC